MAKIITISGNASFRFRHSVELTEEHIKGFRRDYEKAVSSEPATRSPVDHVLVASGGDVEKFLRLATTAGIRTELTSSDWDGLVGKGSIKVNFDGAHPAQS